MAKVLVALEHDNTNVDHDVAQSAAALRMRPKKVKDKSVRTGARVGMFDDRGAGPGSAPVSWVHVVLLVCVGSVLFVSVILDNSDINYPVLLKFCH